MAKNIYIIYSMTSDFQHYIDEYITEINRKIPLEIRIRYNLYFISIAKKEKLMEYKFKKNKPDYILFYECNINALMYRIEKIKNLIKNSVFLYKKKHSSGKEIKNATEIMYLYDLKKYLNQKSD